MLLHLNIWCLEARMMTFMLLSYHIKPINKRKCKIRSKLRYNKRKCLIKLYGKNVLLSILDYKICVFIANYCFQIPTLSSWNIQRQVKLFLPMKWFQFILANRYWINVFAICQKIESSCQLNNKVNSTLEFMISINPRK